jgi:hypothetical protein
VRDAGERGAKLFEAEGEGRGWAVRGGGGLGGFSRRPAWSAVVLSSLL